MAAGNYAADKRVPAEKYRATNLFHLDTKSFALIGMRMLKTKQDYKLPGNHNFTGSFIE